MARCGAQTAWRPDLLRNGEQLLLTLIIPVLLLVALQRHRSTWTPPGGRVDFLAPGVLALAVMSTAFTGQAIATGFERRYGVLKRLGATPLPRSGLIAAKRSPSSPSRCSRWCPLGVGLALGWRPHGDPARVCLLVLLGTAAFSGLGC